MSERYEIQGRAIERRAGVILRDETRLASANSLDAATARAREFVDAGMVAWVYSLHPQPDRLAPVYRPVAHLRPVVSSQPRQRAAAANAAATASAGGRVG